MIEFSVLMLFFKKNYKWFYYIFLYTFNDHTFLQIHIN